MQLPEAAMILSHGKPPYSFFHVHSLTLAYLFKSLSLPALFNLPYNLVIHLLFVLELLAQLRVSPVSCCHVMSSCGNKAVVKNKDVFAFV